MKIECVTTCVGYADFLAETAPLNRHHFDRWVIVTSPQDQETFNLCHRLNLQCLVTDDFTRDGEFNKGRAIQRGMNNLSGSDWILHLDADVALPDEFPAAIEMAHLDPASIYGCDRMMVRGWENWRKIRSCDYHQHGRHCYVLAHPKYPIGTRWASPRDGYIPIGFFQLFHGATAMRNGIWQRPYPAHHADAARADIQFGLQWDRRFRHLIPELLVWHLESENSPIGANWKGRKSKPFGPEQSECKDHRPS
jgi:hypothetical protein